MPSNWGGNHHASPSMMARPRDEAELIELVRRQRYVKPYGALHSWSDAAMDDRCMVSLDHLDGVTHLGGNRVRVGAGIRLHALNDALDALGLAMPILGSVAQQSIAGAASTGTHGSSLQHRNLAGVIRGARLVAGTGEVIELDEQDPRLDAVRVGLGAMGILTELTIEVEPAFNLAETTTPMDIEQAIDTLPALLDTAEYVKLWWLPHTGRMLVIAAARTEEPERFSRAGHWIDEHIVNNLVFDRILRFGGRRPNTIPTLNRLVGKAYFRPQRRVARSDRIFNLAMPPRHREMEYAIPFEATQDALKWMHGFVEQHRVGFIVEVRFVKGDNAWMSPAYGGDVCQLGAYIADGPDLRSYFDGFEAAMLDRGGRPHWGKEFSLRGQALRDRFPRTEAFLELREQLDPDGRFVNPFVHRLLE